MIEELSALEAYLTCASHALDRAHSRAVNLHDSPLQMRLTQVIGEVHAMKLDAITAQTESASAR